MKPDYNTQTTKVLTLNPSRNTLPLAKHTKSIDLDHLKNTQHSLATQHPRNTVGFEGITLVHSTN